MNNNLQDLAPETLRSPRPSSSRSDSDMRQERIADLRKTIAVLTASLAKNSNQPSAQVQLEHLQRQLRAAEKQVHSHPGAAADAGAEEVAL